VYNFGISLAGDPLTGQAVSGVKVARVWSAAATRNVGRRVPIRRSAARKGGGWREGVRRAAETVRRWVPMRTRWRTGS